MKSDFYLDGYTILIGFNLQYGPYAHFGYRTLVSDPYQNKVIQKIEK